MKQKLHMLVADDHPVFLEGVIAVVARSFPQAIFHKAANGIEALHKIIEIKPEIAILDIEMPILNGIEVVRKLNDLSFPTKIIFLTLHKERIFANQLEDLNVHGYVLKEFSPIEITRCINQVLQGQIYFSDKIQQPSEPVPNALPNFTKTELHVLELIAAGNTSKKIAEKLFVSYKTIDSHRYNICKKLDLKPEPNSLLKWALKHYTS